MPLRLVKFALAPAMKWIGLGVLLSVLLTGAGYIYHSWRMSQAEARLQEMQDNRDRWRDSARIYERRSRELERQQTAAEQAVRDLQARLAGRERSWQELLDTVRQAPKEHDGPVAPVLKQTLEVLSRERDR